MEKYDFLILSHDPMYERVKVAIEIVKEFIRARKLIIYGGTAIDFALRLKGDKIYSDSTLSAPDLDFYSYNNVRDSYDLVDILVGQGFEARAINALHAGTMRVDAGNNHFVADISYVPKHIFDKVPTLNFGGMRIVSPANLYIDLHNSLAHPFSNPPQEVIFERWNKDIKRFNKLFSYYPVTVPAKYVEPKLIEVALAEPFRQDRLVAGLAAWALYTKRFSENKGVLTLRLPAPELAFVAENIEEKVKVQSAEFYYPLLGIYPEVAVVHGRSKKLKEIWYSTDDQLVTYHALDVGAGQHVWVVSPQYLLKYLIAKSIYMEAHDYNTSLRDFYRAAYIEIFQSIASVEPPTIDVFGTINQSKTASILIAKTKKILFGEPEPKMPANYKPPAERPNINLTDIEIYRIGGERKK